MTLRDLLRKILDVDSQDIWERLHSMGLSVREVVAAFELLDVDRSHGANWGWTHALTDVQCDPPMAEPSRIEVDGKEKWLYAAVNTGSKLLLETDVHSRRGIGPAAAFLHRLTEKKTTSCYSNSTRRPSTNDGLEYLWDLITKQGANLLGLDDYAIEVGSPVDLVVHDAVSPQ